MKLVIEDFPKTVTVITPTIGSSKLQDALDSIERQTYKHIKHLIVVDGKEYPADPEAFREHITISPHQYRVEVEQEEEINEMRELSGLEPSKFFTEQDAEIKAFKAMAGL